MNKKHIITISAAAVLAVAAVWRLWPHSFEDLIAVDTTELTSAAATLTESYNDKGKLVIDNYNLTCETGSDRMDELVEILNSSYRQSFRNLFGLGDNIKSNSGINSNILFISGDNGEGTHILVFDGTDKVYVNRGGSFRLYYADDETFSRLCDFMRKYGEKS